MSATRQVDTSDDDQTGSLPSSALSASLEDYLEAILLLERASRVARVSEIAEQLAVSRPSVTEALKNLSSRGLVDHARYGHVTLTEAGDRIARGVERRHLAIKDFLTGVLGIPADKAEIAACRMEHVLEPDVLAHFVAYTEGTEKSRGRRRREGAARKVAQLALLPAGARAVVAELPKPPGLAKRLIALGLTPGAEVHVLQNRGKGPLLVEVHGARLALGFGQAARVGVDPLDDDRLAAADTSSARGESPGED